MCPRSDPDSAAHFRQQTLKTLRQHAASAHLGLVDALLARNLLGGRADVALAEVAVHLEEPAHVPCASRPRPRQPQRHAAWTHHDHDAGIQRGTIVMRVRVAMTQSERNCTQVQELAPQ
eukprot:3026243-Rhodomonas_salina.2